MVSNIFYFHPYLGKISNLTNIFRMGWNHQPVWVVWVSFRGIILIRWRIHEWLFLCGKFVGKYTKIVPYGASFMGIIIEKMGIQKSSKNWDGIEIFCSLAIIPYGSRYVLRFRDFPEPEYYPRTCKWLITMVSKPKDRVVGPLPNGHENGL